MRTKTSEDNEWERVADQELSESSKDHEKTAEEVIGASSCCAYCGSSRSSSPIHQVTR